MKLYTKNSSFPEPIPFRIKLSNGLTRTDPTTFTAEEIADAGYIEVPEPPPSNSNQVITWNSDSLVWDIRDKTPQEIQNELEAQWNFIRKERDRRIVDVAWRYERYARYARLNIPQLDDINILDQYVQALADIPQTQTDPFNIVWPNLQ